MLITLAAVVGAVVRVLIEHVMPVVVTAAAVVAVGAAAGGCSNLITSIGTGKDPDEVSAMGCKTDLQSISEYISIVHSYRLKLDTLFIIP